MAELIVVALAILFLWALFRMFRCPRCKTLKSVFSQTRLRALPDEQAEERYCSVCDHTWKRLGIGMGGRPPGMGRR